MKQTWTAFSELVMDKHTDRAPGPRRPLIWGGGLLLSVLGVAGWLGLAKHPAEPVAAEWRGAGGASSAQVTSRDPSQASNPVAGAAPAATGPSHGPMSMPDEALATIPWHRYPSGMPAAAELALQKRDAGQAYAVAADLQVCQGMGAALRALESQLNRTTDAARRQLLQQQWTVRQKDAAYCQAIPGDVGALRLQLLALAVQQEVPGSGTDLALAGQGGQPAVMKQVLHEMALGQVRALSMVADGMVAAATPLQVAAARDALVRGARDPALQGPGGPELEKELDFLQRHAAVDAWKADPGNGGKREAASRAWTDPQGGARLEPSTDPEVRALADQYLAALKRRSKAGQGGG